MFGSVPTRSGRVEILVDREQGWEPLYVARSDRYDWMRSRFEHERFRTYLNDFAWRRRRPSWDRFADWIVLRVGEEFPDVRRVRLQVVEVTLPPPADLHDGLIEGEPYWSVEREVR